ncbi:hypothetical protein [Moraxella lacunata]
MTMSPSFSRSSSSIKMTILPALMSAMISSAVFRVLAIRVPIYVKNL